MVVSVKHTKTTTSENKVTNTDWNAEHTLDSNSSKLLSNLGGVGKFKIPVLITEVDLPALTSTYTFSNLNGDVDVEYMIEAYFKMTATDLMLCATPNGITSNQTSEMMASQSTASHTHYEGIGTARAFTLAGSFYTNSGAWNRVVTKIWAKTGKARLSQVSHVGYGDKLTQLQGGSVWNETSTNITSLVLTPSSGTFEGNFKLYKMVTIDLSV